MAIPATFIQELLSRVDVVDVVGRHVQLKKGGANFMGLCPFHGEKSPSFSVSPTKQFYHCFGCGKNGDAIRFLMEHSGSNFVEAVKDLAQQVGMQVPEDDSTPQARAQALAQRQRQATLTDVLERACEAYKNHLKTSDEAVAYFKGRGLSGEIARSFGLGFAPAGWRSLASVFPDYADALLVESGLVISNQEGATDPANSEEKRYDRFRNRVMFPIRNVKGECIGFGGRVLNDEKPKYLNSPETPVFSKGRELYGLFEARTAIHTKGYALVTEGYMDVVALAQLGFANTVATLGTACTTDHIQKLFRFTDAIVFSFDGDSAGRRAARKALDAALPYANDVRNVKFLFLPAEHDPDSYVREHGSEAFARMVSEATPLSRFLLEAAREDCDLSTAEGRSHMVSNARPLWTQLPDGALKRQLLADIADLAQIGSHELSELWQLNPATAAQRSYTRGGYSFRNGKPGDRWQNKPDANNNPAWVRPMRAAPATLVDHVARHLLANTQGFEALSAEDHALLGELPEPHGSLMVWLESQWHEYGAQPWAALREGLRGQTFEATAAALMNRVAQDDTTPAELRSVLDRLLLQRLKELESQALEAKDISRYKGYYTRRVALDKTVLAQMQAMEKP